jgi:hypothetical protein
MTSVVHQFPSADRRRAERIEVMGHLHGCLVAARVPIVVREASAIGFSIESPVPFPPGASHAFRFSTRDGRQTIVQAVSRHCLRVNPTDRDAFYVSGFSFAPNDAGALGIVSDVLRHINPHGSQPA